MRNSSRRGGGLLLFFLLFLLLRSLRLGGLGGAGLGRLLGSLGNRHIDKLQDGLLGGVTLALAQPDNARVSAPALLLCRSDLVEENFDGGLVLMQPGGSQTAVVQSAVLAQRDHFFRDGPGGFGL